MSEETLYWLGRARLGSAPQHPAFRNFVGCGQPRNFFQSGTKEISLKVRLNKLVRPNQQTEELGRITSPVAPTAYTGYAGLPCEKAVLIG